MDGTSFNVNKVGESPASAGDAAVFRRKLTACTESMIKTFCNMEDVYWQTQAIIYKQDQS